MSTRADGSAPVPPKRPTSTSVSVDNALGVAAVYRSVQIIVTACSQMTLTVTRDGKQIPSPPIVREPDADDTARGFIEQTVFSLATHGNAYWRVRRSGDGKRILDLKVLDPKTVTAILNPDTLRVRYTIKGSEVSPRAIKHLRLLRQPGRAEGLGPIQCATGEIGALLRLRKFADEWFDTSGVPTGTLTTDLPLNPEDSKRFADAWREFLSTNEGIAVLSQGLRYDAVRIKPADAQFLEVQQAAIVNVARLFGVPASYLIAQINGTSQTYANIQDLGMVFYQTTLMGYVSEIEDAFTSLLPRGQQVRMDEYGLLRLDPVAKTDMQAVQIQNGIRSADEIRDEDGREPLPKPPVENGDQS